MKFVFVCLLALVLCACAKKDKPAREIGVFSPANLTCAFRITYTALEGTEEFDCWLAMYGRYLAYYQESSRIEGYGVVRLDIHDDDNPQTAAVFFAKKEGKVEGCMFVDYNSYSSLYHDMDRTFEYFVEPFYYTSNKSDDEWNGVKCRSYTRVYDVDENTTIYVNASDFIIGIVVADPYYPETFTIKGYEDTAYTTDFEMPSRFKGCEKKVYKAPSQDEPNCELTDLASSTKAAIFTVLMAVVISAFTLF